MNSVLSSAKRISVEHNVLIRVIDPKTRSIVSEHEGHNSATHSLIFGISSYLMGQGVWNQGYSMLNNYVPRFISVGTMGILDQDDEALPSGGGVPAEIETNYELHCPGFGADGYDLSNNNDRVYAGLGYAYSSYSAAKESSGEYSDGDIVTKSGQVVQYVDGAWVPVPGVDPSPEYELISATFPRSPITFRDAINESDAEIPGTVDVVFSAMISLGALKQFRRLGLSDGQPDRDHVYISEVGLWSRQDWTNSGDNGLLAGYRILPSGQLSGQSIPVEDIKKSLIRVGVNQVVQVVWKIQLGSREEFMKLLEGIWIREHNNTMYIDLYGDPPAATVVNNTLNIGG